MEWKHIFSESLGVMCKNPWTEGLIFAKWKDLFEKCLLLGRSEPLVWPIQRPWKAGDVASFFGLGIGQES
jgi:hypothetical protein